MTIRSLFYDIANAFERFYNDNDWFAIFPHVFTMSSYLSSGINKINTILVNSNQKIFREVRLCCLLKYKRTNWDWQITEQLYSFTIHFPCATLLYITRDPSPPPAFSACPPSTTLVCSLQARIQGRSDGWIFTSLFLSALLSFFFLVPKILK